MALVVLQYSSMFCVSSQSEKLLLFDTVHSDLEEKIRRLEEDRHSIDITSGTGGVVEAIVLGYMQYSDPVNYIQRTLRKGYYCKVNISWK